MSFTWIEERKLSTLFKKQERLNPTSSEYIRNREIIANIALKRLRPKMEACRRTWQKKYHLDDSDCESLMFECLLTAIDNYKISRGNCKFTSFFWTITSQTFKNYLSHLYAKKRTPFSVVSGDTKPVYIPNSSDEFASLFDCLPDSQKTIDDALNAQIVLEKIYGGATDQQKRALKRLFFGHKYKNISKALNVSPSTITNLIKQLREKYPELGEEA